MLSSEPGSKEVPELRWLQASPSSPPDPFAGRLEFRRTPATPLGAALGPQSARSRDGTTARSRSRRAQVRKPAEQLPVSALTRAGPSRAGPIPRLLLVP